jgi:multicomponent Na+:H+ antiporter subunit E
MKNLVWLAVVLAIFWIVNSGHFDILLLSFGVLSVAIVLLITHLMTRANEEFHPTIIMSARLPFYLLWLVKEIVKSNVEVIRCIWQRHPAIEPRVIRIKASQKSDLFKVLYANSITMTPGTVTIEIEGDDFTVHALTRSSREGLETGDMDRRVQSLER